jgi:hypothetical protein
MDGTQQSMGQHPDDDLDGPVEPVFTDETVEELWLNGQISRAEADVFEVISLCSASGDGEGGGMAAV